MILILILGVLCWFVSFWCLLSIDKDAVGSYHVLTIGKFSVVVSMWLFVLAMWVRRVEYSESNSFMIAWSVVIGVEIVYFLILIVLHLKYPSIDLLMNVRDKIQEALSETQYDKISIEWDPELMVTDICFYEKSDIVYECIIPNTNLTHAKIVKNYCEYLQKVEHIKE